MSEITLGFSPCPNDTFIFDALVHGKIDTGDLSFSVVLEDVQTLNEMALEGRLMMTKFSYGVWPAIAPAHRLLNAGSALGIGVGPLIIARPGFEKKPLDASSRVVVPGRHTSAYLLYRYCYPEGPEPRFVLFHEVEAALLSGEADTGVIIHENRFTYAAKGLLLHTDLGQYWETKTGVAVPLGGIAVRNDVSENLRTQIDHLLAQSIAHAWSHYPHLPPFVTSHAREMDEAVMRQHILLYVNKYTKDLGPAGLQAINQLIKIYHTQH